MALSHLRRCRGHSARRTAADLPPEFGFGLQTVPVPNVRPISRAGFDSDRLRDLTKALGFERVECDGEAVAATVLLGFAQTDLRLRALSDLPFERAGISKLDRIQIGRASC